MIYWLFIFLFFLGAAIGSFFNVVSFRYKAGARLFNPKIIGGRSHCPHCHTTLSWYELIPVISFLIQLGKCRHCKKRISSQYPIIEILSGLTFVIIPIYFYNHFKIFQLFLGGMPFNWYYFFLGIWILTALIFILLSAIDFRLKIIPDSLVLSLVFLGLVLIIVKNFYKLFGVFEDSFLGSYAMMFGLRDNIWINYVAASLFGVLFFGLIVFLSRGRAMGMGDLKLAGAIGLLLGWPDTAMAIFLAFILGSLVGIFLIIVGKKSLKSALPFGPYLAIGVFLTMFFGQAILGGYFKLFGI